MAQLNLYWSIYHLLLSRCIRCRPLPISGPDKSLHRIQLGLSRAATTQCTGKTAATPAQLISVAALISQKKKILFQTETRARRGRGVGVGSRVNCVPRPTG